MAFYVRSKSRVFDLIRPFMRIVDAIVEFLLVAPSFLHAANPINLQNERCISVLTAATLKAVGRTPRFKCTNR